MILVALRLICAGDTRRMFGVNVEANPIQMWLMSAFWWRLTGHELGVACPIGPVSAPYQQGRPPRLPGSTRKPT